MRPLTSHENLALLTGRPKKRAGRVKSHDWFKLSDVLTDIRHSFNKHQNADTIFRKTKISISNII